MSDPQAANAEEPIPGLDVAPDADLAETATRLEDLHAELSEKLNADPQDQ